MREMFVFMDGFENIPLDLKKKNMKKIMFFLKLQKIWVISFLSYK